MQFNLSGINALTFTFLSFLQLADLFFGNPLSSLNSSLEPCGLKIKVKQKYLLFQSCTSYL